MLYPNTVCYTEPLKAPYLLGTKHSFPVSGYEPKLSFSVLNTVQSVSVVEPKLSFSGSQDIFC